MNTEMNKEMNTEMNKEMNTEVNKEVNKEVNTEVNKTKVFRKKLKYSKDYIPQNFKNIGLLIGKNRSNLINLNNKCKQKFNQTVFIQINNDKDKIYFTVKSNSEEVINYTLNELSITDKSKHNSEKFENSYSFKNNNKISINEIHNMISNLQIDRGNYKIWLSDELSFGYLYLRNKEDFNKTSTIDNEVINFNYNNKNKNIKYDFNINIKFRSSNQEDDIRSKVYGILLDEMIIMLGKNKFKIFISKEGNFGKIFLKEEEYVETILNHLNRYEKDDIEFITYQYDKEHNKSKKQKNYINSLNINNICNYLNVDDVKYIIEQFIDNTNYRISMPMIGNEQNTNKGFCRIYLESEKDCIILLNNLSKQGFHGTIWDVTLGKS